MLVHDAHWYAYLYQTCFVGRNAKMTGRFSFTCRVSSKWDTVSIPTSSLQVHRIQMFWRNIAYESRPVDVKTTIHSTVHDYTAYSCGDIRIHITFLTRYDGKIKHSTPNLPKIRKMWRNGWRYLSVANVKTTELIVNQYLSQLLRECF